MSDDKFPDESVEVGDCSQWAQESYDAFAFDGGEMDVWGKQPYGLYRFARADKEMWRSSARDMESGANPNDSTH